METDLIIIGLSLLFSAFFSGSEIAFVSTNRLRIELKGSEDNISSKILSGFVKRPSHFITGLLIGNNITIVIYSIYFARLLTNIWTANEWYGYDSQFIIFLLQTVLGSFVVLIVAEFVPKALSSLSPYRVLYAFAVPLAMLTWPLKYVVDFIVWLSKLIIRKVLSVRINDEASDYDRVDLFHIINEESSNNNAEKESEVDTEIFMNALEFANTKIRDCMIPRTEIDAIEINASIDELKTLLLNSGHSKIIVYKDNIDNIVGYVHSIELFNNPKSIKNVILPVPLATESMQASELLRSLIKMQRSIALVVDEFGGTSGIVTVEDIIEEIFGEIEDEHDGDQLTEKKIADNAYIFSARLEIEYLNEKYHFSIPDGDYDTLGGYLISKHESIPEKGDQLKIDGFDVSILKMQGARIDEVKLVIREENNDE